MRNRGGPGGACLSASGPPRQAAKALAWRTMAGPPGGMEAISRMV
jgi:hypothetical protein